MKRNQLSPEQLLVAIRAKCMECSGDNRREVENCRLQGCPLYQYRSVKAVGEERERQVQLKGQIDVFDMLRNERKAMHA